MTAPYNPQALTRIRNGAGARELGWDDLFYSSVCRRHGITPNVPSKQSNAVADVIEPAAQLVAPAPPPPPTPAADLPPPEGHCLFDPDTGAVQRGEPWVIILPKRQAQVFSFIVKGTQQSPINGRFISERLGIDAQGGVGGYVIVLREKLAPLNIKIASVQSCANSGYYVADLITGEPIKVTLGRGATA